MLQTVAQLSHAQRVMDDEATLFKRFGKCAMSVAVQGRGTLSAGAAEVRACRIQAGAEYLWARVEGAHVSGASIDMGRQKTLLIQPSLQ